MIYPTKRSFTFRLRMTDRGDNAFPVILSVSEGSYAGCTFNILEPEWYQQMHRLAFFHFLIFMLIAQSEFQSKKPPPKKRLILLYYPQINLSRKGP